MNAQPTSTEGEKLFATVRAKAALLGVRLLRDRDLVVAVLPNGAARVVRHIEDIETLTMTPEASL